jgi:hypothetical protein
MKTLSPALLFAACLALGWVQLAHAVPTTILAMKLSDSTPSTSDLDAFLGWRDAGGFNEGNAAAQLLIDNGLDYKNSIVDTDWASVLSVRVAMYRNGLEQKFIQFSPGTSKINFFTAANVTASSYTDLGDGGNFFSIAGDSGIDRHWFINNNYGGCGNDVGQWVVLDRRTTSYVCGWEENRDHLVGSADRGFLYAPGTQEANWNNANVGIADVHAVFVTIDIAQVIPEPETHALLAAGLGLLGFVARRRAAVSTK